MRRTLSSSTTWITKFIVPAFLFSSAVAAFLLQPPSDARGWVVGAAVAGLFIASLVWAAAFKTVKLNGDVLVISSYFRTHAVPVAHLVRCTKSYWRQAPSVTLYFDPPTPFGTRVKIIPPSAGTTTEEVDSVADFLYALVAQVKIARSRGDSLANWELTQREAPAGFYRGPNANLRNGIVLSLVLMCIFVPVLITAGLFIYLPKNQMFNRVAELLAPIYVFLVRPGGSVLSGFFAVDLIVTGVFAVALFGALRLMTNFWPSQLGWLYPRARAVRQYRERSEQAQSQSKK